MDALGTHHDPFGPDVVNPLPGVRDRVGLAGRDEVGAPEDMGAVWIAALGCQTKILVIDQAWLPVWMGTNILVRPAYSSFPSSTRRQKVGKSGAARSRDN